MRPFHSLLHLNNLACLNLVDVSRSWHIQDQRVLADQCNVVPHTLRQVLEWQECNMVRVLVVLAPDLAPDICIREGEHTAVRLKLGKWMLV